MVDLDSAVRELVKCEADEADIALVESFIGNTVALTSRTQARCLQDSGFRVRLLEPGHDTGTSSNQPVQRPSLSLPSSSAGSTPSSMPSLTLQQPEDIELFRMQMQRDVYNLREARNARISAAQRMVDEQWRDEQWRAPPGSWVWQSNVDEPLDRHSHTNVRDPWDWESDYQFADQANPVAPAAGQAAAADDPWAWQSSANTAGQAADDPWAALDE